MDAHVRRSTSLNRASSALLGKYFGFVMNLIDNAGELLASHKESQKSFTEAGEEIENLLIKSLKHAFPNHKFIYEEMIKKGDLIKLTDETTWIINPLEGDNNYDHNFPHMCVSIALYVNKIPEIGVIYNPDLDQKFTARRGRGAFLNDQRIRVSKEQDIRNALISFEFTSAQQDKHNLDTDIENYLKISKIAQAMRSLGSISLNLVMVAFGAADASFSMGLHCWDMAAAALIIQESGGIVVDPNGGEFDLFSRRILVASTRELANKIAENLTQYHPAPRDDVAPAPADISAEFNRSASNVHMI